MVKTDVLEAFANLSNNHAFKVVMDEVRARREAARDEFECATDPWIAGRAQGASILAGELIELADKARAAIESKKPGQYRDPGRY